MLRITDSDINAVYERAVAATGYPYFGLRVAAYILPGMLHAQGYALLASETLEDFSNRLVRYWALAAQSGDYSISEDGGQLRLVAIAKNADLCFETEDAHGAPILRLMRMAYQDEFCPLRVEALTGQQVPGAIIRDGEWVAILFVPQQELSLVISTPQLIWGRAL